MRRALRFHRAAVWWLVLLLVAGCGGPPSAPPGTAAPLVQVSVDGHTLTLDVAPVIEDGRALVPFRAVFEALGAQVGWEPLFGRARATCGDLQVDVLLGCRGAWVGGTVTWMDAPPRMLGYRTLVPLDFVEQAMGASTNWDHAARLITIISGKLPLRHPGATGCQVYFLDVGQGDSILVEVAGGGAALVDGGPVGVGPDVVQYIQAADVQDLDYVVATHPHADHIGGLPEVLGAIPVGKVVDSGLPATSGIYASYMKAVAAAAEKYGTEYEKGRKGMTLDLEKGAKMDVLWPQGDPPASSPNDASVVTMLTVSGLKVLLTGDLSSTYEMAVAGPAAVLKVGHHGSSTSTSAEFLQAVAPQEAVISVGPNSYGHPAEDTLDRLKAANADIYRTDVQGTLILVYDGNKYAFNTEPWWSP